jgi:hypothetical protein
VECSLQLDLESWREDMLDPYLGSRGGRIAKTARVVFYGTAGRDIFLVGFQVTRVIICASCTSMDRDYNFQKLYHTVALVAKLVRRSTSNAEILGSTPSQSTLLSFLSCLSHLAF